MCFLLVTSWSQFGDLFFSNSSLPSSTPTHHRKREWVSHGVFCLVQVGCSQNHRAGRNPTRDAHSGVQAPHTTSWKHSSLPQIWTHNEFQGLQKESCCQKLSEISALHFSVYSNTIAICNKTKKIQRENTTLLIVIVALKKETQKWIVKAMKKKQRYN